MVKIKVDMAFKFGGEQFSGGEHYTNNIRAIEFMRRCGYGKVLKTSTVIPVADEKSVVECEKSEEVAEEPKKRRGRKRKDDK